MAAVLPASNTSDLPAQVAPSGRPLRVGHAVVRKIALVTSADEMPSPRDSITRLLEALDNHDRLFVALLETLHGVTGEQRFALNLEFDRAFGHTHPSLTHLLRSQLSGIQLDIAMELLHGFEPHSAAANVFAALSVRDGNEGAVFGAKDRLLFALQGVVERCRTPHELASLTLSFEFPYQRSLVEEVVQLFPDLPERHPEVYRHLRQKGCPVLRADDASMPAVPAALTWENLELMPRVLRTRLHVLGRTARRDASRQQCERLLSLESFRGMRRSQQQLILEIFLCALHRTQKELVELLDSPHHLALLQESSEGISALHFLHELCFGPLGPALIPFRPELVAAAISTIRRGRPARGELILPWVPPMQDALEAKNLLEFTRLLKDLSGPCGDTWVVGGIYGTKWWNALGPLGSRVRVVP